MVSSTMLDTSAERLYGSTKCCWRTEMITYYLQYELDIEVAVFESHRHRPTTWAELDFPLVGRERA